MASNALITFADSGSWDTSKKPQGARGGLYWTGQSDYAKLYAEETVEDNLDLVIQFGDDNSNGLSIRNKANTQTSYISSSGVITTGTFKGNLDWSYITNKPATATRWPSWAEVTGKPSSFTPSTHTHGLSNSVFFLNMPSINGNAKWKEVFGYPVNYNLLLSVRINNPAPEWCVGNLGSGILYGGSDTKGFMSSAYNEPFIMWAGGNGSSDDSVPKWYIGIKGTHKSIYNLATIASEANAAYNLRHSHANKSVLDGITSALVNNWNTAYNFVSNITGSGLDADTLDGEHASSFVRAGYYESQDLNKLDTYSFIRSVYSDVSSTSPKGNTGWYNVIQLVHRNGAGDGPGYIGQIALGMTTNTNDMFFRGRITDPWKAIIHSGNIGNQTVVNAYRLHINSVNTWSTWNWVGQSGYPRWVWGSIDGTNMYIWNPSNFRVAYASSAGNADTLDGEHASNFSYTHQTSFDFSKSKSGRIVTFDQSNTAYGWINGFASTYSNYLTSVIFNTHRTSNWYVGYMEGNRSTGETNGLQAVHKLAFADGDEGYPIFLGYLRLYNGDDGTISSSFPCLGYSVPFTYTRGGAYCLINIPDTSFLTFYIRAAIASVHYSGSGMGDLVGDHRGDGAWWLYCDAVGSNKVQVKGFHPANSNNDSWWGGNPLYASNGAAKIITVCLFGHVKFK